MKKTAIALLFAAAGFLSAGAVNATTFQEQLTLPTGWAVFENFNAPVVANYTDAGITFSTLLFGDDLYISTDFDTYLGANSDGQSIISYNEAFPPPPDTTNVTFSTALSSLAFSFYTAGPVTFTALLNNNAVAGGTIVGNTGSYVANTSLYYGFSGITFDKLRINAADYFLLDNFAAIDPGPIAAQIPEPGTFALMLAGLGLLGFVARRRAG